MKIDVFNHSTSQINMSCVVDTIHLVNESNGLNGLSVLNLTPHI